MFSAAEVLEGGGSAREASPLARLAAERARNMEQVPVMASEADVGAVAGLRKGVASLIEADRFSGLPLPGQRRIMGRVMAVLNERASMAGRGAIGLGLYRVRSAMSEYASRRLELINTLGALADGGARFISELRLLNLRTLRELPRAGGCTPTDLSVDALKRAWAEYLVSTLPLLR